MPPSSLRCKAESTRATALESYPRSASSALVIWLDSSFPLYVLGIIRDDKGYLGILRDVCSFGTSICQAKVLSLHISSNPLESLRIFIISNSPLPCVCSFSCRFFSSDGPCPSHGSQGPASAARLRDWPSS